MATKRSVTVNDLPHQAPHGVVLRCVGACGSEYSATRGDYFWSNPTTVLECCKKPMMLAQKSVVYRPYKGGAA